MPRPCKRRRIGAAPECRRFGPWPPRDGARSILAMTLDEYETVRLMDREGLTQAQCAERMAVARTTVQAIYATARKKLARCLTDGAELWICGGTYALCAGGAPGCAAYGRAPLHPGDITSMEGNTMKIAVPYENGMIFQHFGRTEAFKLYEAQEGRILSSAVVETQGVGHGALAGMLRELGVEALICGGVGMGARQALEAAGIALYGGVTGDADAAAHALAQGRLVYDAAAQCDHHHGQEHAHHHGACAEHGCGQHGCGHAPGGDGK